MTLEWMTKAINKPFVMSHRRFQVSVFANTGSEDVRLIDITGLLLFPDLPIVLFNIILVYGNFMIYQKCNVSYINDFLFIGLTMCVL